MSIDQGEQVKSLPLWMGEESNASIGVSENLGVLVPKGQADRLSASLELPDSLEAPINAGTKVGQIQVKFDGKPLYASSLATNETYVEGPWMSKILDSIKQLIF